MGKKNLRPWLTIPGADWIFFTENPVRTLYAELPNTWILNLFRNVSYLYVSYLINRYLLVIKTPCFKRGYNIYDKSFILLFFWIYSDDSSAIIHATVIFAYEIVMYHTVKRVFLNFVFSRTAVSTPSQSAQRGSEAVSEWENNAYGTSLPSGDYRSVSVSTARPPPISGHLARTRCRLSEMKTETSYRHPRRAVLAFMRGARRN